MRYRITVRSEGTELRGYTDQEAPEGIAEFAQNMAPIGVVVASVADSDWNPFLISEPDNPPTPELSGEIIQALWDQSDSPEAFLVQISHMHYMQALVIRGERGQREAMEANMLARELHHFEVEQENEMLRAKMDIPAGG